MRRKIVYTAALFAVMLAPVLSSALEIHKPDEYPEWKPYSETYGASNPITGHQSLAAQSMNQSPLAYESGLERPKDKGFWGNFITAWVAGYHNALQHEAWLNFHREYSEPDDMSIAGWLGWKIGDNAFFCLSFLFLAASIFFACRARFKKSTSSKSKSSPTSPLSPSLSISERKKLDGTEIGTTEIKFECPSCRQRIAAPHVLRGKIVPCPSCHEAISIPDMAPFALLASAGRIVQIEPRFNPMQRIILAVSVPIGVILIGYGIMHVINANSWALFHEHGLCDPSDLDRSWWSWLVVLVIIGVLELKFFTSGNTARHTRNN